ncbi:DinB family protein [Heyndrickxia sp. MSNUG]|uniref:DinB family protein n=1 Tax=Heyndrickxia sp. MSNUG TaxID=3136677 RepID=UPI003C2B5ACC
MNINIKEAIEVLETTPKTLEIFLTGLSAGWLECNEGEGSWNATQVIDHLIVGEKTNWIPRLKSILQEGEEQLFPPFDRFAHLTESSSKTLEVKFLEFKSLRSENVSTLKNLIVDDQQLAMTGLHPEFGKVTAKELISTWVVHDLTHISQIIRIMAHRYRADVGPWEAYLGVLKK